MENVITVGIQRQKADAAAVRASLDELSELVETAGGHVVESHIQKRDRPDPATFIGKGKVLELTERLIVKRVHTLVIDETIKPGQQRQLEEMTNAKIIDRTSLILDIFAQRARTREGQLQVELAQLNYLLPRMTERFGRFEQQVGGIGTRGPGERKLEVDQRRIRDRITALKKQIEKVRQERQLQGSVRRSVPMPHVAIVGYTNAGKSTFLNALLKISNPGSAEPDHQVYADDKLFATLDPTTRRIRLPSHRIVLFSDTVGFIQKLPTELIAAFRATLEEAASADLLLHVIDASDPGWRIQQKTVYDILERLKMSELPRLTTFNKMDSLSPSQLQGFKRDEGYLISAQIGVGIPALLTAVEEKLGNQWVEKELFLPFEDGSRLAQLHEHMEILSQDVTDKGMRVRVRAHPATLAQWFKNDASLKS